MSSVLPLSAGTRTRPLVASPLLVQGSPEQAPQIARLATSAGVGAVYTASQRGNDVSAENALLSAARIHNDIVSGGPGPILDLSRYSGRAKRQGADRALTPKWLEQQLDAGAPIALTDSGFVTGGRDELESLLDQANRLPFLETRQVVTIVAIPSTALRRPKEFQEIRPLLRDFPNPVAFVLEHRDDPLKSAATALALIRLITDAPDRSLLRSDYSAIGALAAGAPMAAIGTRSSLRHLYPPVPGGPNNHDPDDFSTVWPSAMSYYRTSTLAEAIALTRDDRFWACECDHCYGRSIEWIRTESDAFAHNTHVAAQLAVRFSSAAPDQGLAAWGQHCQHAQNVVMGIAAESQITLEPKGYLGAWWDATQRWEESNVSA